MQMDIYMRRRLVALAIVVGIFILIVLAIRSCGGDDESGAPLEPQSGAGQTTNEGLAQEEYIAEADAICAEAKNAIENIDPEDEDAIVQELELTEQALSRLQSLTPAELTQPLERYQGSLQRLIQALETKQMARDRGDVEAEAEADETIDRARQRANRAARAYGFDECDGFGEVSVASGTGEEVPEGSGATTPAPETTAPPPATSTPAPPPSDGGAVAPPDAGGGAGGGGSGGGGAGGGGGSGGVTPGSGGVSP